MSAGRSATTRESLLAEWDAIRPSEPMPQELLNMVLTFVNTERRPGPRFESSSPLRVDANAPPPQRFRRSAGHSRPPAGPSKSCDMHGSELCPPSGSIVDLPAPVVLGPDGRCTIEMEELDLAFEAINHGYNANRK